MFSSVSELSGERARKDAWTRNAIKQLEKQVTNEKDSNENERESFQR